MADILKITLNLVLICAAAGVILSATWAVTDPVRVAKEAQEREEALKALVPDADSIKPVRDVKIADKDGTIYRAEKAGKPIGYVVLSYGRGYASFIKVLVAVDLDGKVAGIDVLSHGETPGLGDQITQPSFKDRFKGKLAEDLVVVKGETTHGIQAISGATISSRGATRAVKDAVEALRAEQKKGL